MINVLHGGPCSNFQPGGEDLLLASKLLGHVKHRTALLDVGETSVEVGERRVDVVELGANIVAEVVEELSDLQDVSHCSGIGIDLVSDTSCKGRCGEGGWAVAGGGSARVWGRHWGRRCREAAAAQEQGRETEEKNFRPFIT